MILPLYQERENGRASHAQRTEVAGNEDASPHARHAAKVDADMIAAHLARLDAAILEDLEIGVEIEGLLNRLNASKFPSRHRSIVITHLEEAQDRLRRELGEQPTKQDHV